MNRAIHLRRFVCLTALLGFVLGAQLKPVQQPPEQQQEDVRLPSGKLQKDEILKAEYKKSLQDASDLVKLTQDLKAEMEKNGRYVVSVDAIRKTEKIEKLAKRIRSRMKRL